MGLDFSWFLTEVFCNVDQLVHRLYMNNRYAESTHPYRILCVTFSFLTTGGWGWLLTAVDYIKRIFFRFVALGLYKYG